MYQKSINNSPGIDFNAPALKKYRSLRFLKDRLARWGVASGGLGVILAILLIFFYLLYEVLPLFKSAEITQVSSYPSIQTSGDTKKVPMFLSVEEQAEVAMKAEASGNLRFFSAETGERLKNEPLPVPAGSEVAQVVKSDSSSNLMAAGLSTGEIILFEQGYRITWPDDRRKITPEVSYPYDRQPLAISGLSAPVSQLAISDGEDKLLVAASIYNQLVMEAFKKEEDYLTESVTIERQSVTVPVVSGLSAGEELDIRQLLIDPEQTWLYVLSGSNQLTMININDIDRPYIHETLNLTTQGVDVTELTFLLGGVSLLVGDSEGNIAQWFMVREDGSLNLKRIRSFSLGNDPVDKIVPEHRRKGFLASDINGQVGLFYTTANRSLLVEPMAAGRIDQMAVAPRGNYLILESQGETQFLKIENEHPEISWSALWGKVWYESYSQPDYIWQSSASNNDFEPKLSLMPLSFGTLKAAFYAMLLAAPLAICAAIYTAYFMAPGMRRKVKPVIELMEALPTVILGFLAGLWLAPLIENQLVGIFVLLLFVPAGILIFAFGWDSLPSSIRHRIPDGMQAGLLVPVVLVSGALAMSLSSSLELWLFDDDMSTWLTTELGIPYDQRNALVVGLAMGFAVIPTIFSIAEDAIFSVPRHLTYGSLALGATPWQTLTRVVLLTASPGIFSAVMIGMGRAVGETMIVLMATGNTPIMDANIFEGMRTLAANIAVEMPESEVGSSHYRILFLAALVLFLFTFVVNTVAEMVRHRLRKKYSSL
ncbi:ABC transporter permease subunit [Endozoicomonas elysicola]|uniref:Phosphate ABC transporter permease n=1 Tax=Endozoicomonas elysicola TaxID=305900 RepID=A0A081K6P1_9GAMM|nr:ABC transporter permease subunit [Endozoicomonas elysicola]KEI69817.1 phosphate ABC transporter permease [Endozoicomonas elysicola]